jgi:uncharacterized protein YjbJ (UPF0337 family)
MNKDRVEGKVKDVAGRMERQAGEWTGDNEKQAHGAMKQVEGKVQNALGKVKDAAKDATGARKTKNDTPRPAGAADETSEHAGSSPRKAS